ncbi:microsomal triglyceride transfer protein large subunit isoform X2 [Drosophila innubila]|uniref:microsomal triglyceride transfer protein large subunit isoform X2 n=1 Tax=Drosophila innubila TaxID=198719 RepID=UPI00148B678E|nr:microsomal triglyceride transfer protein large subunit isoform X2 [Drosophila innubila]
MQQRRQTNNSNNNNNSGLTFCLLLLVTCFATASASLIPHGTQQFFELQSKVRLEQLNAEQSTSEEVSYTFETKLRVNSVWSKDDQQLLEIHLSENRVRAPGKAKAQLKERVISSLPDRPFYIALVKGQPEQVIAHTSRDQSLLNLERGIASLLQLRLSSSSESELDVSGHCRVKYNVKSPTSVVKTKTDCALWDLRVNDHPEQALSVSQHSREQVEYELTSAGTLLRAESTETHRLTLAAKPDAGSLVRGNLRLQHVAQGDEQVQQLEHSTLEAAIESLLEWYRVFPLEADVDGAIGELKEQTLQEQFEKNVKQLKAEDVGKSSQALTFVQLLPLARIKKQPQLLELLESHFHMSSQLADLLGAVQTYEAHNATFAHFFRGRGTTPESVDRLEKYLQSLAVATHPQREIIEHLFDLVQQEKINAKHSNLRDSVLQTLATLTRQSGFDVNDPLLQQIRDHLLDGLATSKDPDLYIRALQNLRDPLTIDELLKQATQSEQPKLSVAALQALKSFPASSYATSHRQKFESIFYQRQRRFDSSARTIALDVLLDMRPSAEQLGQLLDYLASNDRQFEIKTYLLQKLRMLAEICPRFRAMFRTALLQRDHVNNYNVLGQKGLTTVLTRQLSQSPAFNETLLSTQEVYQGILKRGSVEFLLHAGRDQASSFKLGVYTAGLGSLVGDGDADDGNDRIPADDELQGEETVTAGMEISVQGAQLRPLIFFTGQTELMGHVWGGSASDSTPAYQATTLAQDHEQYIVLASGATLHWRVLGARSVDLNGKVGFSLWNRNAQTEIQQNTGSAVLSHVSVGFTYAKLEQDFTLTHEPKLSLQADLDFYSGIKLCMQLQRPEQLLTYSNVRSVYLQNVEKTYAKHLRLTTTHKSAGLTFALNQKNNEMCNMIFANA